MVALYWSVLTASAVACGLAIVAILVVPRPREPLMACLGILGILACAWSFAQLSTTYDVVEVLVYAFGIALAGLGGGYALGSALLYRFSTPQRTPSIVFGEDVGRTRVLLFACAEPASYEMLATSRELNGLAEEGLIDLTLGVTPFMYAAQKARYRAIGGTSPARAQAYELAEALEAQLPAERFGQVSAAWCDGPGDLPHEVARSIAEGYRRIVVAVASVGQSAEMAETIRVVDQMRLADHGVALAYTPPVWGLESVLEVLVARILGAVDDPAKTGVVLLAHGQPEARENAHRSFDESEAAFVNRTRMLLAEQGLDETHVRIAWAEWREPDVTSAVRHLTALACSRIVVAPACFPFDGLVTRLDLPLGVRQARTEREVSVITLNAWTSERAIVEALAQAVREADEEIGTGIPMQTD